MAVISFKCPNCDGELVFEPSTGKYKCEYCASSFSQAELDAMQPASATDEVVKEDTTDGDVSATSAEGEAVLYHCPSCGAEIATDETTAATFCYYCHNPVVLSRRLEGEFLPDQVIPFQYEKKQAIEKFLEYVGKKKFVPKAFFNKKQIELISGVYFPFWLYDIEADADFMGEAKKVKHWTVGDEAYTSVNEYEVVRRGTVELKGMSANALNKANKKLVEGVQPYNFQSAKGFNMGYLSGFQAEMRDIEFEKVAPELQNEARKDIADLVEDTVSGYTSVNLRRKNVTFSKEKNKYILLPVWTLTYKGNDGKIYYFSLNGQTGKVYGELPIDKKKLTMVSAIAAAVAFVVGMLGGLLLI